MYDNILLFLLLLSFAFNIKRKGFKNATAAQKAFEFQGVERQSNNLISVSNKRCVIFACEGKNYAVKNTAKQ